MPEEKMTEAELKEIIDRIYKEHDLDNNGHLDIDEMSVILEKSLGKGNVSAAEIKEFLIITDVDGNNKIEKEELYSLFKKIYC